MSNSVDTGSGRKPRLVVGIGASAGGLDACKRFLGAMPSDSGMAFVIVMHLDPRHESHMAEVLGASTDMQVMQVMEIERLEQNRVYVIAPDSSLEIKHGALNPKKPNDPHGKRKPVDALFSSLAADQGELAVAIVLSGTGNNGSAGIRDIKAKGGLCLAQTPASADYDGMPRNAIATGAVDYQLEPEAMPKLLVDYAEHPESLPPRSGDINQDNKHDRDYEHNPDDQDNKAPSGAFNAILDLLSRTHGVNFRASYKQGTLKRRIERRMGLCQLSTPAEYVEFLEANPKEIAALYADLLIGVTQFFRDADVWQQLESDISTLLERHEAGLPFKAWVAGCATGEEAYSLAIVLMEQRERLNRTVKIQIFATDAAESAVACARRGVYPATIEEAIAPQRLARFFNRRGDEYEISREVRDCVTFAVHNLLTDPPFSQLDMVSCRNVLIYLEPHAQHRIMEVFHFALKPGGLLLLGASETVGRYENLFETASEKARIYRAAGTAEALRQRHLRWTAERTPFRSISGVPAPPAKGAKVSRAIEQLVLSRYTQACVAISESFEIQAFFGPTQDYLVQPTGDARMDLLAWAKPGLYPQLRSALEKARDQKQTVTVTGMRLERGDTVERVECTVEPITTLPYESNLFLVGFRLAPPTPDLAREPAPAGPDAPLVQQLETELKSTREELRETVAQLESIDDEYRASIEELLSLNEELQSSNEEMEASKEELQSLNEEMDTINHQLEDKNLELRTTYDDLNNLVASTNIPIIFLNRDLRVRRFTPAATKLMRLTPADVGRPLENIKERFRDGDLLGDARRVLENLVPISVEVRTEDDHWYARDVLPYRTEDTRIDGVCVVFQDITERKEAARRINEARLYAEAVVDAVRTPLVVLNHRLEVMSANRSFRDIFQINDIDIEDKSFFDLGDHEWDIPRLRALLQAALSEHRELRNYDVEHDFGSLGRRMLCLNTRLMTRGERTELILLTLEDVTDLRAAQKITLEHSAELSKESERKDQFLAMLGHELRNPLSALLHGLNLLRIGPHDRERIDRIQHVMLRQSKRIGTMLDQLLDVARMSAGKIRLARAPVDMNEAIQSAVEAVNPLIESRKHQLILSLPADDGIMVLGDLGRLTQVVENLITNAAKYTEEGGRIELALNADNDTVAIRIRDNGIGMDATLLPRIFELFTQDDRSLDRAGGGLGLGLPLVKNVVEMHGGSVVASSPGHGKGSEFVVTLPRMRERRKTLRNDDTAEEAGLRYRILVVDDEVDTADSLAEILTLQGHTACAAHDGSTALAEARDFHPDIVLLDLGLPTQDGYEVAKRLRAEHGSELVLIALTGYQKDIKQLRRAGFDHHLIKPVDMKILSHTLATHGRKVAIKNHSPVS